MPAETITNVLNRKAGIVILKNHRIPGQSQQKLPKSKDPIVIVAKTVGSHAKSINGVDPLDSDEFSWKSKDFFDREMFWVEFWDLEKKVYLKNKIQNSVLMPEDNLQAFDGNAERKMNKFCKSTAGRG